MKQTIEFIFLDENKEEIILCEKSQKPWFPCPVNFIPKKGDIVDFDFPEVFSVVEKEIEQAPHGLYYDYKDFMKVLKKHYPFKEYQDNLEGVFVVEEVKYSIVQETFIYVSLVFQEDVAKEKTKKIEDLNKT